MSFILILFGNNFIQSGDYYDRKSNLCLLKTLQEKTIFSWWECDTKNSSLW
jgi:hypothetical protein